MGQKGDEWIITHAPHVAGSSTAKEATQEAWGWEEAEKRRSKVLSELSLPCAAKSLQGTSPFGSDREVTCVLSRLGPTTWLLLMCSVSHQHCYFVLL